MAGDKMRTVMLEFQTICDLPSCHGARDGTHIAISKPSGPYVEDYYYHKSGGYNVVAQCVVDSRKRFQNINVGLSGCVNDSRILRMSRLYNAANQQDLFDRVRGFQHGVPPFIIGDKGYPCLPWLMTPYKEDRSRMSVVQSLYNKKLRRGRTVVENEFAMLKGTWHELLTKSLMHHNLIPDIFAACCILHYLILEGKQVDIEELFRIVTLETQNDLRVEEQLRHAFEMYIAQADARDGVPNVEERTGVQNRNILAAYLCGLPRNRSLLWCWSEARILLLPRLPNLLLGYYSGRARSAIGPLRFPLLLGGLPDGPPPTAASLRTCTAANAVACTVSTAGAASSLAFATAMSDMSKDVIYESSIFFTSWKDAGCTGRERAYGGAAGFRGVGRGGNVTMGAFREHLAGAGSS